MPGLAPGEVEQFAIAPPVAEAAAGFDVVPPVAARSTAGAGCPDGLPLLLASGVLLSTADGAAFRSMRCTPNWPCCSTTSSVWLHSGQSICRPTSSFSRSLSREEQCGQAKWNGSMTARRRPVCYLGAGSRGNGVNFFFSAVGTLVIVAVLLFSSTISTSWGLPLSMLPSTTILYRTAVAGTFSIAKVW